MNEWLNTLGDYRQGNVKYRKASAGGWEVLDVRELRVYTTLREFLAELAGIESELGPDAMVSVDSYELTVTGARPPTSDEAEKVERDRAKRRRASDGAKSRKIERDRAAIERLRKQYPDQFAGTTSQDAAEGK